MRKIPLKLRLVTASLFPMRSSSLTKVPFFSRFAALLLCATALFGVRSAHALTFVDDSNVNGSADQYDQGNDVAVDSQGNVYVIGTIYDPAGAIWVAKYDADLTLVSSMTYIVNPFFANGEAITVDENDTVYICGLRTAAANPDIFVARLDSDLNVTAFNTEDGPGSTTDYGYGVTARGGSVYVAGTVYEADGTTTHAFAGKYDSDLVLQSSYTVTTGTITVGFEIEADSDGNVYLVGHETYNSRSHGRIWKLNSNLVLVNSVTVPDGTDNGANLTNVTIDSDDNLYVVGSQANSDASYVWVGKYNTSLTLLESDAYTSAADFGEFGQGIAYDAAKDLVFVVGEFIDGDSQVFRVLQYDSNLNLLTSDTQDGEEATGYDLGYGVAASSDGNLYVAGARDFTGNNYDILLAKYQIAGQTTGTVGSSGGNMTVTTSRGTATIRFPANSFAANTSVTIEEKTSAFAGDTVGAASLTGLGLGLEITAAGNAQPAENVTIVLPYQTADLDGNSEDSLVLARYNTTTGLWVPLETTVDAANNTVTALTDHFSTFQLMTAQSASSVNGAKMYPNPFRPALDHNSVRFSSLPANTTVKIYTITGELVQELMTDSGGMTSWNGRNKGGEKAASGVYYVFVEKSGSDKVLKLVVQR